MVSTDPRQMRKWTQTMAAKYATMVALCSERSILYGGSAELMMRYE